MSALSSAADVGSIYSERKYIRKLRHNEKKVHDSTQKTGKNGKRPPATWGGRHSNRSLHFLSMGKECRNRSTNWTLVECTNLYLCLV